MASKMRIISIFYFLFSLAIAVNALEAGAKSNGEGVVAKDVDVESWLSKIAEDVGDEAAKAAQNVGEFLNEHILARFAGIKNEIEKTISTANDFKKYLEEHDIGIEEFTQHLSDALAPFYSEILQANERKDPSTIEDKFQLAIQNAGQAIMSVSDKYDLPEDETRDSWDKFSHAFLQLLRLIGGFVDAHPTLVANILFFVGSMFLGSAIPAFLGPILPFFGFGAQGPIRGSAAAWAQRYFWGGAVDAGSWFAQLQRAGMVAAEAGQGLRALFSGLASVAGGLASVAGGAWLASNGTANATEK